MSECGYACEDCRGQGRIVKKSRKKRVSAPVISNCDKCLGVGVIAGKCPEASSPESASVDVDVAIVGCGIGGAALALALQQRGISHAVFERDLDFKQRKQGYGLTMQQGSIALARLGIAVTGTASLSHVSRLPNGEVLGCYGRELDDRREALAEKGNSDAVIQSSHKTRHNIQIPRQRLRAMLVHRLNKVYWDHKFTKFESPNPNWVELHFENHPTKVIKASVVVGADGIFSPVTKQIRKNQDELVYLGVIVMLGICNAPGLTALHRRVTQTLDGETRIFTMPFTSSGDPAEEVEIETAYFDQQRFRPQTDVVMWQLSFTCSEEFAIALGKQGGEALKLEAQRRLQGWHTPLPELVDLTDPMDITGYPTYDRDQMVFPSPESQSRCTVLGDAAHCMSPFKGQGANQALVDAISLARRLSTVFGPFATGENHVCQQLREFEAELVTRAGEKVEASRIAAKYLHSKDALQVGNCVRSAASMSQIERIANVSEQEHELRRANAKRLLES
ncbi:hypothetical protein BASA81_004837 [Batrachochytrium salamandrivorans]|nr:hypothetical protein BASA81_004837 [Batrachochytrium salamandrivorans]